MFEHEAAVSHRETFPSRADDYGYTIRPKLERAQDVKADDVEAAYAAVHAWRRYEPPVDLYVAPCVTGELPPEDVDERDVRFPLSAFVRWVNLLGWAALADRQPPADRASRRDGAGRRPRLGAGLTRTGYAASAAAAETQTGANAYG